MGFRRTGRPAWRNSILERSIRPALKRMGGNLRAAATHLPNARLLLGAVLHRMALGGLEQGQGIIRLADGTTVSATQTMGVSSISIHSPPPVQPESEERIGFIVFPTSVAAPQGWICQNGQRVLNPYHHDFTPRLAVQTENNTHQGETRKEDKPYAAITTLGVRRDQWLLCGNQVAWKWSKKDGKARWVALGPVFSWWHSGAGDLPLKMSSAIPLVSLGDADPSYRLWTPSITVKYWIYSGNYWYYLENVLTYIAEQTGQGIGWPQGQQGVSNLPDLHVIPAVIYRDSRVFYSLTQSSVMIGGVFVINQDRVLAVLVTQLRSAQLREIRVAGDTVEELDYQHPELGGPFFISGGPSARLRWPFRFNQSGSEVSTLMETLDAQNEPVTRRITAIFNRETRAILSIESEDFKLAKVDGLTTDNFQSYAEMSSHFTVNGDRAGTIPIALNYADDVRVEARADYSSYSRIERRDYTETFSNQGEEGYNPRWTHTIHETRMEFAKAVTLTGGAAIRLGLPDGGNVVLARDEQITYSDTLAAVTVLRIEDYRIWPGPGYEWDFTKTTARRRDDQAQYSGPLSRQPWFSYLDAQFRLAIRDDSPYQRHDGGYSFLLAYQETETIHDAWNGYSEERSARLDKTSTTDQKAGYVFTLESRQDNIPSASLLNQSVTHSVADEAHETYPDFTHRPGGGDRAALVMAASSGPLPAQDFTAAAVEFGMAIEARPRVPRYLVSIHGHPLQTEGFSVGWTEARRSNHPRILARVADLPYRLYPIGLF